MCESCEGYMAPNWDRTQCIDPLCSIYQTYDHYACKTCLPGNYLGFDETIGRTRCFSDCSELGAVANMTAGKCLESTCSNMEFRNPETGNCQLCSTEIEDCNSCVLQTPGSLDSLICSECDYKNANGDILFHNFNDKQCTPCETDWEYWTGEECRNCHDEIEWCGRCMLENIDIEESFNCYSCLGTIPVIETDDETSLPIECGCDFVSYSNFDQETTIESWDSIDNPDTAFCSTCPTNIPHCNVCDGLGLNCIQCADGWFEGVDGQCTTEVCREWDTEAVSIDEPDNFMCIECNTKCGERLLTQGNTCVEECSEPWKQAGKNTCELECPDGWYPGISQCLRCNVDGCKSCNEHQECTECFDDVETCLLTCDGENPVHDYFTEKKCVQTCDKQWNYLSPDSFGSFNGPRCATCDQDCLECKEGPRGPTCVRCPIQDVIVFFEGEYIVGTDENNQELKALTHYGHLNGCTHDCPLGFYADGTVCNECMEHCAECDFAGECITCQDGFALGADKHCSNQCVPGSKQYFSLDDDICVDCPADMNCDACIYNGLFNQVACNRCPEGTLLTPDFTCRETCEEDGFFLVIDEFGEKSCVDLCPEGQGPDYNDQNICKDCFNPGAGECAECYFEDREGHMVCEKCGEGLFLFQDPELENTRFFTTCIDEFACSVVSFASPVIYPARSDREEMWVCDECNGFFDHKTYPAPEAELDIDAEAAPEPTCVPCTQNFCGSCSWSFEFGEYTCLSCNEGAVYDPATKDCRGECGPLFNSIYPTEILDANILDDDEILTETCLKECPDNHVKNLREQCLECDFEHCQECVLNEVTLIPEC